MKYIAYGSNMNRAQMAYRCPGAKLVGTGYLPNHRLEFYLHATVEHSLAKDAKVPVVVWEIDENDERRLDRYEGWPTYYTRERRIVRMADGSEIAGLIYMMNHKRLRPPTDDYINGILTAYLDMGFRSEIAEVLNAAIRRSAARLANQEREGRTADGEG